MADGFRVDLTALEQAAAGVNTVLGQLKATKVADLGGASADYGHAGLADTVADFCDRWELGVEHLATDGQQVASRLSLSVLAYRRAEQASKQRVDQIVQSATGPDPAATP
jgi:hypothetical protein